MRYAATLVAWAIWFVTILAGCGTAARTGNMPSGSQEPPTPASNATARLAGSVPNKQSNYWKIEFGMTEKQVIAILGRQPDGREHMRPGGSLTIGSPTWCYWDDQENRISVFFENNISGQWVVRDMKWW
jgi:hypothetical protein